MLVRDIMSDYFASAHFSSTIGDVMEKMLSEGLHSLLIVDNRSQPVGRIDESFLMVAAFNPQLRNRPAIQHMQRDIQAVNPNDLVSQAVEKFLVHQATELPVLSDNKLIGVLTRRQLLRAVMGNRQICQDNNPRLFSCSVA